jgi:hypothetical protein
MSAVTTYRSGGPRKKPFSFSFSKLKNFETCPKRHNMVDLQKAFKEEESGMLLQGNLLHDAFAKYVTGKIALPEQYEEHREMLDRFKNFPGQILVEQQLAIDIELKPVEWFSKVAWNRSIGDIVLINKHVAYAGDYKTGKPKDDYAPQLGLLAQCIFAHFPEVQAVRSEFLWLGDDAVTRADYKRDSMVGFWGEMMPRVMRLKHAYENDEYPAKPSGLCRKYCPVSSCTYHGKGG